MNRDQFETLFYSLEYFTLIFKFMKDTGALKFACTINFQNLMNMLLLRILLFSCKIDTVVNS